MGPVVKDIEIAGLVFGIVGTACWGVCFWWMHRISVKQETMLQELHAVIKRIEDMSKEEQELIREVHPAVHQIKDSVKDVAVAVEAEDGAGQQHRR